MTAPARTRVKICGVRDVETALVCAEAGADAVGLVFAGASPRCVTVGEASAIVRAVPPLVTSVGLFVDAEEDEVVRACEECRLGMVQLHGSESPAVCARVRERTGLPVLRAVRFDEATIGATVEAYRDVCDGLLVDGSSGGHGEAFDWDALVPTINGASMPIVAAGGLTPQNVRECVDVLRPYAVDVSSGVESSRGVKDHALIRRFVERVRGCD